MGFKKASKVLKSQSQFHLVRFTEQWDEMETIKERSHVIAFIYLNKGQVHGSAFKCKLGCYTIF